MVMRLKLKQNEFICPICRQSRQRGIYVQLGSKAGTWTGIVTKICKRAECKKWAKEGDLLGYEVSRLILAPLPHLK